jgi:hypothetical protein
MIALARKTFLLAVAVAALAALVGCEETTGPSAGAGRTVSLSIGLGGGGGSAAPALMAAGLELNDGLNTLVIESAELVMRELEFERAETFGCDLELDDDACEEFEIGPFLVALPLDGSVSQEITAVVDTGTYDEIEFEIHKVEDSDLDFLAANPEFTGISIRVTGTYNGEIFEYTSKIDEEQEIELTSPLVVTETSGPVNVTLTIDVSTWFADGAGSLVDPRTGNDGMPNESLVTDNVRFSIEGFRDDDHDGISHDDDPDEEDDRGSDL